MNAESILQRVRIMLSDVSGVKYSDAQLHTALSLVLAKVNSQVPHIQTLHFIAMVADHILPLPGGYDVQNILSVECQDSESSQKIPFRFDGTTPEQVILPDETQSDERNWRVKMITTQQIEGLDGAVFSTIPDHCETLLSSGTAAYALQIRNTQLAESANQDTAHYQALQQNMHIFEEQFQNLLYAWQAAQPLMEPILPDGKGWQLDD